jgi:Raf kinase inhibitor-like YbhB/YbcL family protein
MAIFADQTSFKLSSSAFENLKTIPMLNTCKGENLSPELHWVSPPKNTKSFALTCIDYDAPSGKVVHWIIYNIPSASLGLDQGIDRNAFTQGTNHLNKVGYDGPCPPPGKPHKYIFTLYALDIDLKIPEGVLLSDFENDIQSHVIAQTQLTGLFGT